MNFLKNKLARVLVALVISAAITGITLLIAVYLGQALFQWLDTLAPRTQRLLSAGMILLVSLLFLLIGWRYRKASKKSPD